MNRVETFQVDRPRSSISNSRLVCICGIAHHDRVGRGERLQPSRCSFADRHQLPCSAGTHKVTDQHKAACDADTC